jgi:hypothetical protein
VSAFDFNLDSGALSNHHVLVDYRGTSAEPDGMVVEYVFFPIGRPF